VRAGHRRAGGGPDVEDDATGHSSEHGACQYANSELETSITAQLRSAEHYSLVARVRGGSPTSTAARAASQRARQSGNTVRARPQQPTTTRRTVVRVRGGSPTNTAARAASQRATQSGNTVRARSQQPTQSGNTVRVGTRQVVTGPSINVAAKDNAVEGNPSTFRRRSNDTGRDGSGDALRRRGDTRRNTREETTTRRYYRPPNYGYPGGYGSGYRHGYYDGYTYGYYRGYHRGFHFGHYDGYFYRHRHWYGPHLVFGYHFGGFGFYHGYWHFAIVVGSPYVAHHNHYYNYTWWNGRGRSLSGRLQVRQR
jgi:hypothetical protein